MDEPIKYYYDLMSPPSRALYILFKLNNVPFESKLVALRKGEQLTDEYKYTVNKLQKLPVIDDNGFKLTESIAILRYQSHKGRISDEWYPAHIQRRARVDEYLEWHHNNTHITTGLYFILNWVVPLMTGEKAEASKLKEVEKQLENVLDLIETVWLDGKTFITGNKISVADLFAASSIEQAKLAGYNPLEGRNKIKVWMELVRNETNPYYDEAHIYAYRNKNVAKL